MVGSVCAICVPENVVLKFHGLEAAVEETLLPQPEQSGGIGLQVAPQFGNTATHSQRLLWASLT